MPADKDRRIKQTTESLIVIDSVTTSDGEATGLSIIDSTLVGAGANSFENFGILINPGDFQNVDIKPVSSFNNATGEVTVVSAFKSGQVTSDTRYMILLLAGSAGGGGGLIIPTTGTHTHANNIGEQIVFTITVPEPLIMETLYLDLVNLVQNANVRVYYQIDAANYRVLETFNWTTGMDDGVYFRNIAVNSNVRVTLQSTTLEGAVRDVEYEYLLLRS
jgi:hypothetical protein